MPENGRTGFLQALHDSPLVRGGEFDLDQRTVTLNLQLSGGAATVQLELDVYRPGVRYWRMTGKMGSQAVKLKMEAPEQEYMGPVPEKPLGTHGEALRSRT